MNLRGLLRRRAPDPATVTAEVDTAEWDMLVPESDHSGDLTPDLFDWPATTYVPPEYEQLGSWLESLSPERRQVLAESVSSNGFPQWIQKWEESGDWHGFLEMCELAFSAIDEGIPAAPLLYAINGDLEPNQKDEE